MMHARAWRPAMFAATLIPVLALSAAPAFAATTAGGDEAAPHIAVQFGDLDLSSAKGRHILDARLRRSAATVCGYDNVDSRELFNGQRQCYETALKNAHTALAMKLNPSRMASSR